jgi:hypothetical protein
MNVVYGSSVLVVGALIRSLPENFDEHMKALQIDEYKDLSEGNKVMQAYQQHLDGKVDEDFLKQLGKKKP